MGARRRAWHSPVAENDGMTAQWTKKKRSPPPTPAQAAKHIAAAKLAQDIMQKVYDVVSKDYYSRIDGEIKELQNQLWACKTSNYPDKRNFQYFKNCYREMTKNIVRNAKNTPRKHLVKGFFGRAETQLYCGNNPIPDNYF